MTLKEKSLVLLLLSIPAVFAMVTGYREFVAGLEAEYQRKEFALIDKTQTQVMEWFEKTWVCKGFDINRECVIRERRP